jgi:hypothetical protein
MIGNVAYAQALDCSAAVPPCQSMNERFEGLSLTKVEIDSLYATVYGNPPHHTPMAVSPYVLSSAVADLIMVLIA